MTVDNFNPGVLKFCAWMGPVFTLVWLVGAGPITGWVYLPPPSASNSANITVAAYTEHLDGIRIGCVFMIFASMFYAAWGTAVSIYSRRAESGRPVLFYIQIVCMAACVVVVIFIGFFWGVAAFRPGETGADVTQALNDLGWFGVLFTGAPFTAWAFALAAATLMDKSERPAFPRWTAYLNIFAGLLFVEASLILFFKTGPFSQDGIMVFYAPMVIFFVWIVTLSWALIKAVNVEKHELESWASESGKPAPAAVLAASQ